MIAPLVQIALPAPVDFDALAASIAGCDRKAVAQTIADDDARHSRFLVDAYKEQRAVAQARIDLAERRRRLRAKEAKTDTEEGLRLEGEGLDDRARTLADARSLDGAEQDTLAHFRARYLRVCSGKPS